MTVNRRQFIKRGAGAVTASLMMPRILLTDAMGQSPVAGRKIFVVIQLGGGNDGLNTIIPYSNSRYASLRPTLSFKDSDLKDGAGNSMIISAEAGLHPALAEIKGMYDQGKVAIVQGVGYPTPNLSHFTSTDIWMTATAAGTGDGWLGKYADQKLYGKQGIGAAYIGGTLPKVFFADNYVTPAISNFATYTYQTDGRFTGDRNNQLNCFNATNRRDFAPGSFLEVCADAGVEALSGAQSVQAAVGSYTSPVTYPANNPLAAALRMAAQMITTIPTADLLYVQLGGFDHHSQEIGSNQEPNNKLIGAHATLLGYFSKAVKAFYDDMAAHNLADEVVLMQWSEFGRRPNENASRGTDHGTAAPMIVIGDPVKGGLYGNPPSLEVANLDNAGNMRFTTDFRDVYATILDSWLRADSRSILGAQYSNLGFIN